ncbi:MAG: hypothetical protein HKN72_12225, partial [Gemmatimonadetes bacterium]|nr:hypothetical protein [Gemmatimonadota bacterium]
EETALNSLGLLVSGVVLVLAWFAFKREKTAARIPLFMAMLLGIAFVGLQGVEWAALLADGLTIQSSTYGAFFYLIVGAHGVHALGALAGLAWAFQRLDQGALTSAQLATVSAFWYFVVLVWPVLYWTVYL